jgi:hypothetical protein
MTEFGATEKWTAKQCGRKWQEISFTADQFYTPQLLRTPTFAQSYTSSPVDGPTPGYFPFAVTSTS